MAEIAEMAEMAETEEMVETAEMCPRVLGWVPDRGYWSGEGVDQRRADRYLRVESGLMRTRPGKVCGISADRLNGKKQCGNGG